MKRIICILLAAVTLSGCATFGVPDPPPGPEREARRAAEVFTVMLAWGLTLTYLVAGEGGD